MPRLVNGLRGRRGEAGHADWLTVVISTICAVPLVGSRAESSRMANALHDRRGDRVGLQAVQALAGDGLARVGVRAEIDQVVAVLRATAETQERLLTVPRGPGTVRVGLDPAGFD
jgi:hypothetical protein